MRKKWIEKMAQDSGKWETRIILAEVVIGVVLALGIYKLMGGGEAANLLRGPSNILLPIGSAFVPVLLLELLFVRPLRKRVKVDVKSEILEELHQTTDPEKRGVLKEFLAQLEDGERCGKVKKRFKVFKKEKLVN